MLSANDRAYYKKLAENRPAHAPPKEFIGYRKMFEHMEPIQNAEPLPNIADYQPSVQMRDGLTTAVAIPYGEGPFPVIVHAHGNGGIAGSAHTYRGLTYDLCRGGYVVFMIDYRLAPEHPFPAGYDDMVFALQWVRENAAKFGGDPDRMVLSGNSTGAGLAFSVCRTNNALPNAVPLKAIVGLDGRYDRNQDQAPGSEWMIQCYIGQDDISEMINDPRISPSMGIKKGELPPTLLITGSLDHVAPSTLTFARKLVMEGIPIELHLFEGTTHDFMRLRQLEVSREAFDLVFRFLDQALAA